MVLLIMSLASSASAIFATKTGIIATVVAAEAASSVLPVELAPLVNLGAIGCVLLWFMLRSEPRMQKQAEAIDRMTMMNGYVIIALKSVHPEIKEQVQVIVDQVEAENARRNKT